MIATMAASRGGAHLAKNTSTGLRVTQARVLRSEWTKFTSLRSTLYTLLVAVVLTVGFGALFAAVTAIQYARFSPAELARFNPIITSLDGVTFSVLAVGVLGVLLMSGEYSTGMIRASLSVGQARRLHRGRAHCVGGRHPERVPVGAVLAEQQWARGRPQRGRCGAFGRRRRFVPHRGRADRGEPRGRCSATPPQPFPRSSRCSSCCHR